MTKLELINCISKVLNYTLIASEEIIEKHILDLILFKFLKLKTQNYKPFKLDISGEYILINSNLIIIKYVTRFNCKGQAFPDINIYKNLQSLNNIDEILIHKPDIVVEVTKNDNNDSGNMMYQRIIKFLNFDNNESESESKIVKKYIVYDINIDNYSKYNKTAKISQLLCSILDIQIIYYRRDKVEFSKINIDIYNNLQLLKILEYCINSTKPVANNNRFYRPISKLDTGSQKIVRTCPSSNSPSGNNLFLSKAEEKKILKLIENYKKSSQLQEVIKSFNHKYSTDVSDNTTIKNLLAKIKSIYDIEPENEENRLETKYIINSNLLHSPINPRIHDPNTGFVTALIYCVKKLDPSSKFLITGHNLNSKLLNSNSKMLQVLQRYIHNGDIEFKNNLIDFKKLKIDNSYCKLSKSEEKNISIYTEKLLINQGWIKIFSDHAGGGKSNIMNIENKTYYQSSKFTINDEVNLSSRTQGIPDLIMVKDNNILVIEAKKNTTSDLKNINQQVKLEIKWFNQNIKQKQNIDKYNIYYGIVTYGGKIENLIINKNVNKNLLLNDKNLLYFSIFHDNSEKFWVDSITNLPKIEELIT